jgi:DNA-binding PucR family transcriptional regulator
MQRVSRNVLGGLDALPAEERGLLLDTLETWLTNGGSAAKTAQRMFCHPNTVRHRLRRIEERTGRSLTDPLDTSEICVALQTERRLPAPEAGAWPRTVHG